MHVHRITFRGCLPSSIKGDAFALVLRLWVAYPNGRRWREAVDGGHGKVRPLQWIRAH